MTRKTIRKLLYNHRLYRSHEPRLAVLDERAQQTALPRRMERERQARREDKVAYEKSIGFAVCTMLTKRRLWEIAWLFCSADDKTAWREIVAKF